MAETNTILEFAPQAVRKTVEPAYHDEYASLFAADALDVYDSLPSPIAIVSDGAYGISGFPGDPPTVSGLRAWYEPHVKAWSRLSTPQTALWFWNTEVGWATVHPLLVENGWEYVECNIWNKGIAHVAGNSNTKTLRRFPVVSEVCVHYVKPARFLVNGRSVAMKEWLRWEWRRAGLPLSATNEACDVKNAATRKYFTQDHVWYFPPAEAFEKLVAYANRNGRAAGRPYFSTDGQRPLTGEEWSRYRSKFKLRPGVTNVWDEPANRGLERIKANGEVIHYNQKPMALVTRILDASTDEGDVVWEPFGGLCTAAAACNELKRRCYSIEILPEYFEMAVSRLRGSNLRLL